jgi:ABC-type spermidine/putrescine transport system permease subunit II
MSFSGQPLSGIPNPLTLRWYQEMLVDTRWASPLWASIGLGVLVGLCSMVVATAVGRAIPRLKKRGGVLLFAFLPMFVPGLTMGAALFLFLRSYLELRLGLWSVFLGQLVWALPFSLLLVLVLATRFDHRLLDAASDLGASAFQRFWHIEFPIMRPAIIGAGLFGFLLSFTELPRSLFLRGTSTSLPIFQLAQASSHQSMGSITFALASIIFAVTIPLMGGFFWFLFAKLEKGA